jgi:hypothetical protein
VSVAVPRERVALPGGRSVSVPAPQAALFVVAVLTAAAFALRVSQLHQSLVGDEVFTYQDISGRSFGAVLTTVHEGGENSPPLFFLLAWISAQLGDPSVWIRVPSLVLGTATVPVVYALGRATLGRLAGLIGAAILAVTPFAVFYGVEARPYATMTFFVALSTLALVKAVRSRSRWWVLYVATGAAAAYTHYTSIFVLAVQALWSLWVLRDRIKEPLIAGAAIVILYIPWLPQLRGKALAVIGGLYPLTFSRVISDVLRPIPGHPSAPLRAIPTVLGLLVVGACVLAGLVAAGVRWRATRSRPSAELSLVVALALATPIGLLAYSLLVTDLWLPRGLSASMPAIALLVGALLASLPRPLTVLAGAAVLVTLIAGTLRSFDATYARGPFRAIAQYLDRHAGPRNPIAIGSLVGRGALSAQFHRHHWLVLPRDLPAIPPGQTGFLVLDDVIARRLEVTTPQFSGLQLVGRRHYSGSFPTDVLTYRRS